MSKDRILQPFLAISKDKFTIDTIEDLMNRKDLIVGDVVDIQGYYTAGDGAHHKRKVVTDDDGSGVQLANGLWANIVHSGEVNVSWFGAKGDGISDDTVEVQRALDFSTSLNFENKKFLVSVQTKLNEWEWRALTIKNGINIHNGHLKLMNDNSSKGTKLLVVEEGTNNVKIENMKFEGYKLEHTIQTGEFGHNLDIRKRCVNITVRGCEFINAWGDGIETYTLINSRSELIKNVIIENNIFDGNSRNNLTIGEVENIVVRGNIFLGADRTEPMSNIDIEPTLGSGYFLKRITIENNKFLKGKKSIGILNVETEKHDFDVIVRNNVFYEGVLGIENVTGVEIKENTFNFSERIYDISLYCRDCDVKVLKNDFKYGKLQFEKSNVNFISNFVEGKSNTISNFYTDMITFLFATCNTLLKSNCLINGVQNEEYKGSKILLNNNIINSPIEKNEYTYMAGNNIIKTPYLYQGDNASFRGVTPADNLQYDRVSGDFIKYNAVTGFKQRIVAENITTALDITKLNTPYHTTKMQQEGVYEDFIQYMDSKTEYDRLQREVEQQRKLSFEQSGMENYEEWLAEQPMMLPVENEPQPSEALLKFKEKYLG